MNHKTLRRIEQWRLQMNPFIALDCFQIKFKVVIASPFVVTMAFKGYIKVFMFPSSHLYLEINVNLCSGCGKEMIGYWLNC